MVRNSQKEQETLKKDRKDNNVEKLTEMDRSFTKWIKTDRIVQKQKKGHKLTKQTGGRGREPLYNNDNHHFMQFQLL